MISLTWCVSDSFVCVRSRDVVFTTPTTHANVCVLLVYVAGIMESSYSSTFFVVRLFSNQLNEHTNTKWSYIQNIVHSNTRLSFLEKSFVSPMFHHSSERKDVFYFGHHYRREISPPTHLFDFDWLFHCNIVVCLRYFSL